jgi:rubredoxin
LKQLGYTDVDVVEADLPDKQAEAFLIADNHIASQAIIDDIALQNLINELGDMPAIDYGFDKDDLDDLAGRILAGSGGYQADEKDDDVPEVKEAITQKGDLWHLSNHRVLCGDSTLKSDVDRLCDGCRIIEIDRWFPSSKRCHVCGYINDNLTLSDRSWLCPECNTDHDRDVNASINILTFGRDGISRT